ncbi:MAG: hypothetical protein ACTS2F_14875 [Thainema sp.]
MNTQTLNQNLVFDETFGTNSPDYAFLKQLRLRNAPSEAPFGFVAVTLRALDSNGDSVPSAIAASEWSPDWSWEVRTTDNEIRQAVTLRWLGQASCRDRLTLFRVTDPEGEVRTQDLEAKQTVVSGSFMMQSFRVETIKNIAISWASQPIANGMPVPIYANFDLVGNESPATRSDRLLLEATCADGEQLGGVFYPQIVLRVNRIEPSF